MKFETPTGHKYKITWVHKSPSTTCTVEYEDSPQLLVRRGSALCSDKDQFSRDKGRKYSMARALSSFPEEDRVIAWTTYRDMTTPPRW